LKYFSVKNVLQVCTDAIYTTIIPETILDESKFKINFDKKLFANAKNDIELEEVQKRYNAERKKKPDYIYHKEASSWTINYKGILEFPPSEVPSLSTNPKLITLQKPYLIGQEETNLLAKYHRKQNPGLIAMTYHKYFHLGTTAIDE
ncbi:2395_t:CDS:2, partial [Ambispora leptoticha]